MTIIVTGAAGFIGANIVKGLNERGITDIIVVDNLSNAVKFKNLVDCEISHYLDKFEFNDIVCSGSPPKNIEAIFHQGACSDTMNHDGSYMMKNNYQYSIDLLDWCQDDGISLLYASSAAVYGKGSQFREERNLESPLNIYGYSKFLFDQVVRQRLAKGLNTQIAGFRYFNVYGMRENHKGRMASVAYHHFNQYQERGFVELFGAYDNYPRGGQTRDFISVEDVVKVNLYFYDHPEHSGIFNLGTGSAQPFNDIALSTVNACRQAQGKEKLSLEEMIEQKLVQYVNFPEALKGKYQSFTQADISKLRQIGYAESFYNVEEGISRYVQWLLDQQM